MNDKEKMIEYDLKGRDIHDERVLNAMREIKRELFVPDDMKEMAYEDAPLPIGRGQTISQPYIVAYMSQELGLQHEDKVLEIGSGCGYNAAVMSRMVSHVYSVEIIEWLADLGTKNLAAAAITNVSLRFGDGYKGWPGAAPFDKIMITAATRAIPEPLKQQLKSGGKILAPVSNSYQKLILMEKIAENKFKEHELIPVRFVPMTGKTRKN